MNTAEAFGQNIRKLRTARGMTQEQVALEAGLALVYVNEIENGKRNVSIETVVKLAGALKTSPGELLDGVDC